VVLVIIGCVQSSYLVARGFRHIQWRLLLTRILLFAGLGLPVGIWFYHHFAGAQLKILLGVFIILVSLNELVGLYRRSGELKPLPLGILVLLLGGFIHGIFATGGPLIVMFSSRALKEKAAFRATMSFLWLSLNFILLITFILSHRITKTTLQTDAILLPALLLGILAGELLHQLADEKIFRFIVQIILLATGIFLLAR